MPMNILDSERRKCVNILFSQAVLCLVFIYLFILELDKVLCLLNSH